MIRDHDACCDKSQHPGEYEDLQTNFHSIRKVVEPLRSLFKDEVRRVGKSLNIDSNILGRHPFPGPGLGIRILGNITAEKTAILQEVDDIFISALKNNGLYDNVWQAGDYRQQPM